MDENKEQIPENEISKIEEKLSEVKELPAKSKEELELQKLKDKYLRTLAELENTRKRSSSDVENAMRSRGRAVAEQFLPLVDAIDAATVHSPDDKGIKTLKQAADNTLTKVGIVRIETVGQIMNPQFHNAIMTEDSDKPTNTIIREMQSGFMFGDTVLRAAMVAVSKEKNDDT